VTKKIKSISLVGPVVLFDAEGDHYKIKSVTNTVEFGDKRYLTKKEVAEICDANGYSVTIQPQSRES
jgi:hypothetical protein